MRTSHAGSLRFPELRQSSQGESGPKPRLRSVGDGHAVHIRQPRMTVKFMLSGNLMRSLVAKCAQAHERCSDEVRVAESVDFEAKG